MGQHYFISYSRVDGKKLAIKLSNQLARRDIPVWLDVNELRSGDDWDEQIAEMLRACQGLLFLMTQDSVQPNSECKREWTRALRYKKSVIPLRFDRDAEMPMRLEPRHYVNFTGDYERALATLHDDIQWRASPPGVLRSLNERLADAKRDLPRAEEKQRSRIEDEIRELTKEIEAQEYVIAHPEAAAEETKKRIDSAMKRERQTPELVQPESRTKFINPPPARAPTWFQDRHVETSIVANFLKEPALRLITVVGRGGVGKTAMICRLLKALESGHLPDDGAPLAVDGILYLSPKGLGQINLGHLFTDLCKLLPTKQAEWLETVYRNPQASVTAKIQALLEAFPRGRTVVLLDNFEEVVDQASGKLLEEELNDALRVLLEAPEHGIKAVITTRVAPKPLQLIQPGRQKLLELDEGLASPFAENILRAMDADGKLGLRDAPDELLVLARERTLGYPRALEALKGILAADRSTTLEEVLAEAEDVLPENVVEVLVGEAFSRLDPSAQQVMQALAALAAPVPEAAVDYLLQPYVPDIDSAPVLHRLVNMLFARREGGYFHLHQVDRSYALERLPNGKPSDREAEPLPFTRYALLHRAAGYFEQIRTPRDSWKSIDDLAPQLAEFEVRVTGEEYDAAATVLLEIDFNYLMRWGHARLVAQMYERLQGRLSDKKLITESFINLGNCYFSLDDYSRAIEHYEQSLVISREIGNRQGEGRSLGNLGNCYYSLGDYSRAIEHYEQSLAISRDIGNRQGEGNALCSLGNCCFSLSDYSRAIEGYEQYLAISRDIGDRQGEGNALGNLGNCYFSLSDYSRAIEHYEQSLAISRDISDRQGEGNALGNLGNCYFSLSDYSRAIEHYEQSLAISRDIGNRQGEGIALGNLGPCYDSLGDYSRAIEHHEQSLVISREIGNRYGESDELVCFGNTYTQLGQLALAHAQYQAAIRIANETGNKQNQHQAHYGLAFANLLTEELTAAQDEIQTAQKHDYPSNNAAMWTLTGIIQLRLEARAEACEAFSRGQAEANGLLEKSKQNVSALDTKALALCGLALCKDILHRDAATETFQEARQITQAKGVVTRVLKQFDALVKADTDGLLKPLRKAAKGEK